MRVLVFYVLVLLKFGFGIEMACMNVFIYFRFYDLTLSCEVLLLFFAYLIKNCDVEKSSSEYFCILRIYLKNLTALFI